jgi:hypothetical protein
VVGFGDAVRKESNVSKRTKYTIGGYQENKQTNKKE